MDINSAQPPVLLLRGLLRESRHWLNFPNELANTLQRPVLSLDLPGCGQLHQLRSASTVPELRAQLQAQWLLRYPEYQQPVDVIAISMGGMLALDWALAAPSQIKSLTLINSSSAGLSPLWQRFKPQNYLNVLQALVTTSNQREQLIWQMTVNSMINPQILAKWQQWAKECPVTRANALRQLWAASRFRISAIPSCRMQILSSALDRLVSSECSRALAEKLQAPLFSHATAGHDLPLEDSEWLVARIAEFLQKDL
jgi:pimeloyl-ACP methyl ester carboxylesterase